MPLSLNFLKVLNLNDAALSHFLLLGILTFILCLGIFLGSLPIGFGSFLRSLFFGLGGDFFSAFILCGYVSRSLSLFGFLQFEGFRGIFSKSISPLPITASSRFKFSASVSGDK